MRTEIFIEGEQLDITSDISALFTYAVDDVADFGSRDTNYSKTINLPGTGRNNRIFGMAFEVSSYNEHDSAMPNVLSNFNAAKAARCIVLISSIQVFKGILRLMKITMEDGEIEYEAAIFGELGGLAGAIGNRLLTGNVYNPDDDLDFSNYNQLWNTSNITNSWNVHQSTGGGAGVFWPLVDYGNTTTNQHDYTYRAFRPAFYVKEYIEKIFEKAGYTYDCPFFNTAVFNRLVIPHNEDRLYKLTDQLLYFKSTGQTPFLRSLYGGGPQIITQTVKFQTQVDRNNFTASGTGNTTFTYTPAPVASVIARIVVRLNFEYGGGEYKKGVDCKLKVNGTTVASIQLVMVGPSTYSVGTPFTHTMDRVWAVNNITLNNSDVITVVCDAVDISGGPSGEWAASLDSDSSILIKTYQLVSAPASHGNLIQMNNCIPKGVQQRDFLASVVKMFNLYIMEDTNTENHVIITPFPDLYDNTDPLDWSGKLDRGKPMELTPMSEVNARYFNFLYEKDSDHWNEKYTQTYNAGYGDYVHDVGLDFVKDKKDLKLIFASSPLVGYAGRDKMALRLFKQDDAGVQTPMGTKIRILQAKRVPAITYWIKDDLGNVLITTSYYGYAGHVDDPLTPSGADLNWGAPREIYWQPIYSQYVAPGLFAAFYSAYMAEITDKDSKLLTCYVRLTPIDIYQLSFKRAVNIDGQLFRLNKIADYDAVEDGTSKTELLKVINIEY